MPDATQDEDRKPINPLERRETIGVEDGSRHDGPVTPSRHGTGIDRSGAEEKPAPKATPSDTPPR